MKRVVLTGGPGSGKTAILEMTRRALCAHVGFVPESASIVFGGGFPRQSSARARSAAQRAIFHVQRELESLYDDRPDLRLVLCDRGTVDGVAYWPRAHDEFFREVGTTRAAELARYDLVIHLRPPPATDGYCSGGVRIETAEESARVDALLEEAWREHPRRAVVASAHDFVAKATLVLDLVRRELPEACVVKGFAA